MSTADTNVSASERPLAGSPGAAGTLSRDRALMTLRVLVRREFWEHRALWMAPVVTAVLLIACAFPAHIDFGDFTRASSDGRFRSIAWFAALQWGLTILLFLIAAIVVNFYLLDCLYAERKDRSILFWKSLPVSDGATVFSKLLVAQAAVPLGVYLLSIPTILLFSLVFVVRASLGYLPAAMAIWDTLAWLKVEVILLLTVVVASLWYVPMSAYLLLVSAWARRSVFLWATLPPVLAVVLEHVAFGTRYVWTLMAYRTGGIFDYVHMQKIIEGTILSAGGSNPISLGAACADLARAFGNIDLWIGLVVGVALTYAAARIRRYRDDT